MATLPEPEVDPPVRRFIPFFVVVALAAAACGGGAGDTAATVNGEQITVADVEGLRVREGSTIDKTQFAEDLRTAIVETIAIQAASEQFGIAPTDEEGTARLEELRAEYQAQGQDLDQLLESQGIPPERALEFARLEILQRQVAEQLAADAEPIPEEEIQALYDQQALGNYEVCLQHVLVATAEEAEEVVARLEAGEDFATVAEEVSTDPSAAENGGNLGCAPASQYVPEFAQAAIDAEVGSVVGPVESEFGFHVIKVDDRTETGAVPPFEEARAQILEQLEGQRDAGLFEQWFRDAVIAADVQVEAEYGTWAAEPEPTVTPPGDEAPAGTVPSQSIPGSTTVPATTAP
jgi:parvulin-like peptidyl-prolyl isomerase